METAHDFGHLSQVLRFPYNNSLWYYSKCAGIMETDDEEFMIYSSRHGSAGSSHAN